MSLLVPLRPHHPTIEQTRLLARVVLDLADDLGVSCAVVIVDGDGEPLRAQRAPQAGPIDLEAATIRAREALAAAGFTDAGTSAGLPLDAHPLPVGAIGVGGGPPGFAAEAVRSAVEAAGFGRLRAST